MLHGQLTEMAVCIRIYYDDIKCRRLRSM